MGRIDRQEALKTGHQKWIAGKYYDYPDGEDLGGKLWFATKISAFVGSVTGAVSTSFSPMPSTVMMKVVQNFQFIVPSVTASTVFTVVTYLSTNWRKKDDEWNHAIGGLIGGAFLGMSHTRRNVAVVCGIGSALVAVALKQQAMKGDIFTEPTAKLIQPFYKRSWEKLSFIEERKGNWTSNSIS